MQNLSAEPWEIHADFLLFYFILFILFILNEPKAQGKPLHLLGTPEGLRQHRIPAGSSELKQIEGSGTRNGVKGFR